ncbi:Adaptor protein complex AP-1 gamma subunit [Wilcoxina mikolae CBS 423.85]|nr:Adaptor protein complex AP-1 gamma subunit [Wilcoxina mikolae CBS 423.85]
MSSLKQFIKEVRKAKTIQDERSVVQKESAAIRASFREESGDQNVRRNNVSKLLYLFTLGERTHFGQIECLKLLASPRFADKRLGYLGTMLLLDENQEVLTLVTNSLKNDLEHPNQYVVGLALCTLGNIASQEMARDLFQEVESLLSTANPYIQRKAALCTMRIIRKVPDLQEHFLNKTKPLLQDRKNHGVLLCGITLATDLCLHDPELIPHYTPYAPVLVQHLKKLTSSGYAPEHDVTGITDPFLQVKILRLLRILGKNNPDVSEQINDILTQVATNTDSSKNVGNSILYEAVLTIFDIEADSGRTTLGINILGKFLTNKDNNIRYVALNTLHKVVSMDPKAVRRHERTIFGCLEDPDISIRRRAIELAFTLINNERDVGLVDKLLNLLSRGKIDNEFKSALASKVSVAADRFAPNKRWHIDTMLRVLKLAGNYVKEQIMSSFIRLIATSPSEQDYCVRELYAALREARDGKPQKTGNGNGNGVAAEETVPTPAFTEGLTLAGSWVLGEYGHRLLEPGNSQVPSYEIVATLESILESPYNSQIMNEYAINALMKLSTRLPATDGQHNNLATINRILRSHTASLDVEIQQRSAEYSNMFSQPEEVRIGVFENMPPPEIREENRVLGEAPKPKPRRGAKKDQESALLDLLGEAPTNPSSSGGGGGNLDLLNDILGGMDSPAPPSNSTSPPPGQQRSAVADILDLFGSSGASASPPPPAASSMGGLLDVMGGPVPTPVQTAPPSFTVYSKNNLEIGLQLQRMPDGAVYIKARLANSSFTETLDEIQLQAAAPRGQKLELKEISSTTIPPAGDAQLQMRLLESKGALLRLRFKISFKGVTVGVVRDQFDWAEKK